VSEEKAKYGAGNGTAKACIHCRYSVTDADMAPQGLGRCIRFPPAAFPVQGPGGKVGAMGVWPTVRLNHDTCGEFEAGKIEVASRMPVIPFPGPKEG